MKEKTNYEILHDTFVKYCFNIPYIRYVMIPIFASTCLACYFDVHSSIISQQLTKDFTDGKSPIMNILKYTCYVLTYIVLKHTNEIVFSGPVQFLYKIVGVEAFFHYISLNLENFTKIGSGKIQMIIERKSRAYGDILELTTLSAFPTFITVFLAFVAVYRGLGADAFYVMLVTSALYVYITFVISIWRNKIKKQFNLAQDKLSNKLQDFLANHETIKSYNSEEGTISYFDETQKPVEYFGVKSHRIYTVLVYLQKMTFAIQAIIIVSLGAFGYFPIKLSTDQLVFYLSISKTLTSALTEMGLLYNRYTLGFINAKTGYYEFKEDNQQDKIREVKFENKIEFKNVTFSYLERPILVNADFVINKGEKVAIIGKNGTGKSTIIKLLMKFYDWEGEIKLDDLNIKDIADRTYRNLISYATQSSFLFDNTVTYNINYGTRNVTDKEIFEMAKKIGVYENIFELRDGFNTSVGERGRLLSGGERQKIMLMRALLKDTEIMLLDEPTSALDKTSELEIMNFIFDEFKSHTFVMIVHNLELLALFDKILFVNDQKVRMIVDVKKRVEENPKYFTDILNSE